MLLLIVIANSNGQNSSFDSLKKDSVTSALPINAKPKTEGTKKARENPNAKAFHTPNEIELTVYYLVFGFIVLIITAFLLHKSSIDSHTTFKYFIIVLLILSMLLLIATGLNNDQIAPAVGLFGTIAGYLLGKTDFTPSTGNQNNPSK